MAKKRDSQLQELKEAEALCSLIKAIYSEVQEIGRRKPEAILNKPKVEMINRLLTDARETLINQPGHEYLGLLDDETLPQYSDAILILSQYVSLLKDLEPSIRRMIRDIEDEL